MSEIRVPVFGRFVESYPNGPAVEYQRLSEALTARRRKDVFLTQYSNPDVPHRLEPGSGMPPCMVLVCFDVDGPGDPEWFTRERAKYRALVEAMGAFAYETRRGYRLVFELPEARFLRTPEDEARWTADYLAWCKFLNRRFRIVADTACANWSRLFRVPHSTRDKGGEPENLPTLGPAHDPGIWLPELAPEDLVQPEVRERGHSEKQAIGDIGKRVALAMAAAEDLPPAIAGKRGHDTTLRVADAIYRGLGLPRDLAMQVLEDVYNPRCQPPWKAKELEHKLDAVERNRDGWGEDFDAYELVEVAEQCRPKPREPADPDEGPPLPKESDTPTETPHTAPVWQSNAGDAIEYFIGIGPPTPTGFETLDKIAGGGQRRGEPFVIGGAPDAGKTTLAFTIAYGWAQRGMNVAITAFDEPKPRMGARVGQALGYDRAHLYEGGDADTRAAMNASRIRIYDGRDKKVTVEGVAKKLAEFGPGAMVIDSLQTCRIAAEVDDSKRLEATCAVIWKIAIEHKHLVIVTSEINRPFYINHEQALLMDPMAAFSGSHAIEYMMMFGVVLLTPPAPAEHVLARVAKNKLGFGRPDFALKFDRGRALACETPLPSDTDREDFGPATSEVPAIDLERIIWSTVRDTKFRIRDAGTVVGLLRKQGVKFDEKMARLAWKILEGDRRIQKEEGGYFRATPWPDL